MVDLGWGYAIAVNASGQVVGQKGDHAFSWTQSGGMVHLSTLGGARSDVGSVEQQFHSAVNAGGQVVGWSQTTDGSTHAFSWTQGGGMIDLGTLGGKESKALVVNELSDIIGYSEIADGKHHAVLWIPLIVTDVSFGPVPKDASSDKAIHVKNAGTASLTISDIGSPAAPFSIAGGTCTASTVLQGGESCTVSVRFSPTGYGPASSSFPVTIGDPQEVSATIHLSGKGGVPHVVITPTEIDFGGAVSVKPSDRYVTVRNDESANCSLTISGIGSPAAPFSIVGGDCSAGRDLLKGESCTIQVRFLPTDIGVVTSSFNIISDDPENGSVPVSLSGKGARIVVEPDEGTIGSEVTITGWSGGFGEKKGKLLIGGVAPKITEWHNSEIKGTLSKVPALDVPSDIVVQPKVPKGTGPITEPGVFTVRGPKITSVDPGSGVSGSTSPITIAGDFFSTKKGKVTLEREGVAKSCKVLDWTMDAPSGVSTIQFLVPKKLTPAADYTLKVSNSVGSDTRTFAVTAP
jgi:probable HAF family extracellular repeat protein